ncbi:MAG: ABC transporter permease [Bacteroides sp.]
MTITHNKTRSLLTAFGVFWGIFMLVVLIGGGNGMQKMMMDSFSGIAQNACFVESKQTSEPYKGFRKGRRWDLTINDVAIIRSNIKGIGHITPILFGGWTDKNVVYGDKSYTAGIKGVLPEYAYLETQQVKFGRFINDMDVKEQRKVCFIGTRIYEALFKKDEDPTGKYIRVGGIYYQVIGTGKGATNMSIGGNAEETIVLPFTTMQNATHSGNIVHMIGMTGKPGTSITSIQEKIEKLLKEVHTIAPTDAQAFFSLNTEKLFKQFDNLFLGIHLLIWIVGLGTLFAGIIGVSNIMMVTVKERTGEIGIRRAIGARPVDIMRQILSESMVLTLVAGMAGICFAVLVLQVANVGISASKDEIDAGFQISFGVAIGTGLILLTLGTLSGLAPAYRAMSIKPIEAIREE